MNKENVSPVEARRSRSPQESPKSLDKPANSPKTPGVRPRRTLRKSKRRSSESSASSVKKESGSPELRPGPSSFPGSPEPRPGPSFSPGSPSPIRRIPPRPPASHLKPGTVCNLCAHLQPVYRFCNQCNTGFKFFCGSVDCWHLKNAIYFWDINAPIFQCFRCLENEKIHTSKSSKHFTTTSKELVERRMKVEAMLRHVVDLDKECDEFFDRLYEEESALVDFDMEPPTTFWVEDNAQDILRDILKHAAVLAKNVTEAMVEEHKPALTAPFKQLQKIYDGVKEHDQRFLETNVDLELQHLEHLIEKLWKFKEEDEKRKREEAEKGQRVKDEKKQR